jgi:hypothetical protein
MKKGYLQMFLLPVFFAKASGGQLLNGRQAHLLMFYGISPI